jgi:hypothetical protein
MEVKAMSNVYLSAVVNSNGSLTIPAFAARGLGYQPGNEVQLALPTEMCSHCCNDSELLIRRVCDDYSGEGYSIDGMEINIPFKQLNDAKIPMGSEISVLSSEGMLIIAVASGGLQRDLTDELGCFMAELGYDPQSVETVKAALPF